MNLQFFNYTFPTFILIRQKLELFVKLRNGFITFFLLFAVLLYFKMKSTIEVLSLNSLFYFRCQLTCMFFLFVNEVLVQRFKKLILCPGLSDYFFYISRMTLLFLDDTRDDLCIFFDQVKGL